MIAYWRECTEAESTANLAIFIHWKKRRGGEWRGGQRREGNGRGGEDLQYQRHFVYLQGTKEIKMAATTTSSKMHTLLTSITHLDFLTLPPLPSPDISFL